MKTILKKIKLCWNKFIEGDWGNYPPGFELSDIEATELFHAIIKCPICKNEVIGHSYFRFAVTIANEESKEDLLKFFNIIKDHNWEEEIKFQQFNPNYNAVEAVAIKCDLNNLSVFLIKDPVEIFERSSIIDYEILVKEQNN